MNKDYNGASLERLLTLQYHMNKVMEELRGKVIGPEGPHGSNEAERMLSQILMTLRDIQKELKGRDSSTVTEKLLTIKQAAEFLNLAVPTVYGLVSKKEIPHSKRGKLLYFSKKELADYIKAGRRKTNEEQEAEAEYYIQRKKERG